MPNKENVEKHKYKTGEKRAVENGRLGGFAGAITKQRNKDIRVALEALLEKGYNIKDPDDASKRKEVSGAEALALVIMNKALRGDNKAFELVRDTSGQKPVDKVMVADVDAATIAEVERMVEGDEAEDEEEGGAKDD